MATGRNFLMAQLAKRGLRSAGGFARRGIGATGGRVKNALETQQARRRQAERGLSAVGAEEFESKNYQMIAEKERMRLKAKMGIEHSRILKAYQADITLLKENVTRLILKNKLGADPVMRQILSDPVLMNILNINLLKKITELRKSGEIPKPPNAQKAIDSYITNVLSTLRGKLAFAKGRSTKALALEINGEIANTLNEVANPQ